MDIANKMIECQWIPVGVPALIKSDQGRHFVGAWWKAMCAMLGIRQAFAQAYHHQANGRAERAGQELMELARKIFVEQGANWAECLPQIIDKYHDVKGPSWLSPYQILFGLHRPLGNVTYTPAKECEDACSFFNHMKVLDEKVSKTMEETHQKKEAWENSKRKSPMVYAPGDLVWYGRPENTGSKLDSRWLGKALVVRREGTHANGSGCQS